MRKSIVITLVSVFLTMAAFTATFAQEVPIVATHTNSSDNNVNWNGSALSISETGDVQVSSKQGLGSVTDGSVLFTGLKNNGYIPPSAVNGNNFQQLFTGGTFSVTDPSGNLLSGSFTAASLDASAVDHETSAAVIFTGVTYSGGQYFPAGYLASSPLNGLVCNFTLTSGFFDAGAISLGAFTGNDGLQFSAVPQTTGVPEPASFATFGIGAFVMLAMAGLAKRRSMTVRAL